MLTVVRHRAARAPACGGDGGPRRPDGRLPPTPGGSGANVIKMPFHPSGRGGGGTPPGSPAVCGAPRLRRFLPHRLFERLSAARIVRGDTGVSPVPTAWKAGRTAI